MSLEVPLEVPSEMSFYGSVELEKTLPDEIIRSPFKHLKICNIPPHEWVGAKGYREIFRSIFHNNSWKWMGDSYENHVKISDSLSSCRPRKFVYQGGNRRPKQWV